MSTDFVDGLITTGLILNIVGAAFLYTTIPNPRKTLNEDQQRSRSMRMGIGYLLFICGLIMLLCAHEIHLYHKQTL